jgi:putative phosphoesterase
MSLTLKTEKDATYCKFGAETLSGLVQTLEKQIDGVAENVDIEYVHKMRVASRKLRAAMPLFKACYPKKQFKKWLCEIKNITQLLGEARDLDVQISYVESYLSKIKSPEDTADLQSLIEDYRDRRKAVQLKVGAGLDELQNSAMLNDMKMVLEQTARKLSTTQVDTYQVLDKAYWHIVSHLADFLALEQYVQDENAIAKHHQMRIAAKKLRYTMEIFEPIYNGSLSEEIAIIKQFQDILGDKHDREVWISHLKKLRSTTKDNGQNKVISASEQQANANFLAYVQEAQKVLYSHFVQLWQKATADNFFAKLREKANAAYNQQKKEMENKLLEPNVKVAVLADVHANIHALQTVISDAEARGAEIFLNAGDIVGYGPCPNQVIRLLCVKNAFSIAGNLDREVTEPATKSKGAKRTALKFAQAELKKAHLHYLADLPTEIRLNIADKKVLMVHGSPESIEEHLYHNTPISRFKQLAEKAQADIIVVGHSHDPFHKQVGDVSFINPGSVGRPGDGNPQAAYALFSFNPFHVELIRLDYDVKAAVDVMRKKGLPESFSQMLLRGIAITAITKEDKEKQINDQNCRDLSKHIEEFAKKELADVKHSQQVRKLSLRLFDQLKTMHKMEKVERRWLESAASLHDLGINENPKGHHKRSMTAILNETALPFASEDRRIVASIARYHRKARPKPKHYNIQSLDQVTIEKITALSSLLRLADALDYSHGSLVKNVTVKVGTKKVTIQCATASPLKLEEQAFDKKKDLFEAVFDRKVQLRWIP